MSIETDPEQLEPETDAGTETLRRFRYQALLTLPLCLECALGDRILKVIPEHLEDIALSYSGRWRFLQVKSRNPELGLWTLGDLTGSGGALHSLYRTYQQTLGVEVSLELILEGAASARNPIKYLSPRGDHAHPDLVTTVAQALEIDDTEAISFLSRVTVASHVASREEIEATNHHLIHEHARQLSHDVVTEIHGRLVNVIEDAMRAGALGADWPAYVTHPADVPAEFAERLSAKTLARDQLRDLVAPITTSPRPLLRRMAEISPSPISDLERKMVSAGADTALIFDARTLRMNVIGHLQRRLSADMFTIDEQLEDLKERVLIHANSRRSLHRTSATPAVLIWNDLLPLFSQHAANIDPDRVLAQDPMLILGELCDLSDECVFDWGYDGE